MSEEMVVQTISDIVASLIAAYKSGKSFSVPDVIQKCCKKCELQNELCSRN
jgi:hypothetical protein